MHGGCCKCAGAAIRGEPVHHVGALAGICDLRLALVHVDWAHVRAVDVYAVFNSFTTEVGDVEDVTVYLSQYGEHSMQQEALHGPSMSATRTSQVLSTCYYL